MQKKFLFLLIVIFLFANWGLAFNTHHPINMPMPKDSKLPTKNGKFWCTTCHIGHSPNGKTAKTAQDKKGNPAGLRMPYNELCLTCHTAAGNNDKNHINVKINKMAKDAPDIAVETCASCHSMHFAKQGLTLYVESNLCMNCHTEKRKQMHKPMPMMAALASTKKIRLENEQVACQTCHSPHNEQISKHYLREKKDDLLQFCSTCHGEGTITIFDNYHKKLLT